jgi:hypothetical protein
MHEWQSLSHVRWGRLLSERETRGNHTWGRDDSIVAGYSRANRLSIQWSTVWVWLVHYTYLGLEFKYGVPQNSRSRRSCCERLYSLFHLFRGQTPRRGWGGERRRPSSDHEFSDCGPSSRLVDSRYRAGIGLFGIVHGDVS